MQIAFYTVSLGVFSGEVERELKLELPKRVINLPEQVYELATTLIFSFVNLSI